MSSRSLAGALLAATLLLVPLPSHGVAFAEPSVVAVPAASAAAPPAPAAPAAAPTEPVAPSAQAHGAIVVAIGEGSGPAARALAHDVYRDAALRPAVDEASARVLAGDRAPAGPGKLADLADLRASIAATSAATGTPGTSDVAARRLLASLGADAGAALVVVVVLEGGRPLARVLRVDSAAYERVELGATIERTPEGATSFHWPGAPATLRALLAPPAAPLGAPLSAPLPAPPSSAQGAPLTVFRPVPATPEKKPFWSSPWFWGPVAGVAAIGLGIFIATRVTAGPGNEHIVGRVGP